MRVLHLTDLHYKNDVSFQSKLDQILSAFEKHLDQKQQIDMVFFTGDLVFSGAEKEDFTKAKEIFIDKVIKITGIEDVNFLISCGNHDVHRNQEMDAISSLFNEKITSNKALDDFVSDPTDRQFLESCKNTEHNYLFMKEFYEGSSDIIDRLYSVHIRNVDNQDIGIVNINSAWRSNSDKDRGKLLFPQKILDEALQKIDHCERKFLLMHHPLEYFTEFNSYVIEDIIYQKFQYLFSGHVHKQKQALHLSTEVGIFACTTPASFTLTSGNTKIGYTLLDIDLDSYNVAVENCVLDWQNNIFSSLNKQTVEIPLDDDKKEKNEFRKKIRENLIEEIQKADELFVSGIDDEHSKGFLSLFSNPNLNEIPDYDFESSLEDINKHKFDYENLLISENNYVVYGKNKSGKTSLLKKIQLDLLSRFAEYSQIPYYLDFTNFIKLGQELKLINNIARYYRLSKNNLISKLDTLKIVLLVDNFDISAETYVEELKDFLTEYPNSKFIGVSDQLVSKSYENPKFDGKSFSKIFIHDIKRKDIRSLSEKWPSIPKEKIDQIIKNITDIFNQLNIPYNYWTVSLFLWIFEKTNNVNLHNNIELIKLYIDNLLERHKLAIGKAPKLDYDYYKLYLGELANYLVVNYYNASYRLSYTDLVSFTDEFRNRNQRFVIQTEEIVNLIIEKGIISKVDNDRYSFRLRGVFEYFVAYNMVNNNEFKNSIIKDDKFYLSFSNELELYSGFVKNDVEFLQQIFDKTQKKMKDINTKYSELGNEDYVLLKKLEKILDISGAINQIEESKHNPLDQDTKDTILDTIKPLNDNQSAVIQKEEHDPDDFTPPTIERYLFVLSRVFKNLSQIQDEKLVLEIFDFILDSYCNFGFYLMDEAEEAFNSEEDSEIDDIQIILDLMKNFIPLIVQVSYYNALTSPNLERIILNKINSYKGKEKSNQYKLFMLYFLLIDVDPSENINYFDELRNCISINILETCLLVKLYYYLTFECQENKNLESKIRKKIQKIVRGMGGKKKTDLGALHKKLEARHKEMLIRRSKEMNKHN